MPRQYSKLPLERTIDSLPPPYAQDVLRYIQEHVAQTRTPILVVLDDDPARTQTCHDIDVSTVWDHKTLCSKLSNAPRGFFILTKRGGLIVAGSYVPKTTEQLAALQAKRGDLLHIIELDITSIISSPSTATSVISTAIAEKDSRISAGTDVLVMTSRKLVLDADALSSLSIGGVVAEAMVKIVQCLQIQPRYIVAKSGITSSDAATKCLRMKKAKILGQAAPGVPLWRCDEENSKFQGVAYVVFPGNVGGKDTLMNLVASWA